MGSNSYEGSSALFRVYCSKGTPLMDRFWSKVNKTQTCWGWVASCDKDGYGQFKLFDHGNGKQRVVGAHKMSWYLEKGEWPPYLCHTCDNRKCVNPNHLYLGSNRSNQRDRKLRNPVWSNKWGDHMIRRIRRVYALGISSSHIADELEIPKETVLHIIDGRIHRKTGGPIRNKSQRRYGNRFQNSKTRNSRSAARFLTVPKN